MEREEFIEQDTIFALSTPSGSGALAVVRLSGPKIVEFTKIIVKNSNKVLKSPREQVYSAILAEGEVLDYGLVTYFSGSRSYTGEDSLELTLHCSRAVLKNLFRSFAALSIRQAEPGEFSKRAYLNGKIDLAQAEAVLDLINSETMSQVKAARAQLEGKLSKAVDDLGEPLRDLLAEIEANIDFPEEDISPSKAMEWVNVLNQVNKKIIEYVESFSYGRILREGALIVLAGVPNAGKSSLMNALLRDDRVIVTDTPGTTRDSIEERIEISGVLCRIVDTAGLAEGQSGERLISRPEALGIEKSKKIISEADLVLFLFDRGQENQGQLKLLEEISEQGKDYLLINTKSDLYGESKEGAEGLSIFFSLSNPNSLVNLEKEIANKLEGVNTSASLVFTNERHRDCLVKAQEGLSLALKSIKDNAPIDITSFEVRAALSSLSEIVGNTEIENILGRIFSKFCIGK